MDLNKIGLFIVKLREEKNLTQAELSEKVGVHITTVSKWERGLRAPDISVLDSLSQELGVSIKEILNGERNENIDINIEALNYYEKRTKNRVLTLLIILTLVLIIIFTSIFAMNNYKQYKIFQINSVNSDLELTGLLIYNPYRKIIIIKDFEYFDYNIGTKEEIVSNWYRVKLYSNNKVIGEQFYEFKESIQFSEFLKDYTFYVDEVIKNDEGSIKLKDLNLVIEYKIKDDIDSISFNLNIKEEEE